MYPLKFVPIQKEKIWGGKKLKTVLNKQSQYARTGESWELSALPEDVSVVSEGALKGQQLTELIADYKHKLLGKSVYEKFGNDFPLLIKFIDAADDLSVQVHPDDKTAQKKYKKNGKNECWYIIDHDKDAELIIGLKEDCKKDVFEQAIKENTLTEKLNSLKVQKGDVYFIPAGRIHAIKSGVLLAEIQQSSDITYRIYDWHRKGLDGKYRNLHIEEACAVSDLNAVKNSKTNYAKTKNSFNKCVANPYFVINFLRFDEALAKDYSETDSFVIYICTKGQFRIKYGDKETLQKFGETVLLPAALNKIQLIPNLESELLEVYIPKN